VLTTAHATLIAYIENPQNDGKITIDEIYKVAGNELNGSSVGFLFGKNLPASVGNVTVKNIAWLPEARKVVNTLKDLSLALGLATVGFALAAMAITRKRRNMAVLMAVFSLVFMACTLVALTIGANEVAASTASQYSAAAKSIYEIITQSLYAQTLGFAALLGGGLLVAFVTSNISWVAKARAMCAHWLDAVFLKSFKKSVITRPEWLRWLALNKIVIGWTLTGVMFVVFALRLPPSKEGVIAAMVGSTVVAAALAIAASLSRTLKS
jgi:hypothetical protein